MTPTSLTPEGFFGYKKNTPKTRNSENKNNSESKDAKAFIESFNKDLLKLLGQENIKKTPKMNNKKKIEEPLSEDMKKEIIELF